MHFGGLEDDRKDYAEPHITFRSQQDSHRQCGLAICTFHLGFSLELLREYLEPAEVYEKRLARQRGTGGHRRNVPDEVRMALYAVQRGVCPGCGFHQPHYLRFEADHIIALADDGETERRNLQLLCSYCNRVKGTAGSHGYRLKMKELRSHNVGTGVMVDEQLAALTGKRLTRYHSNGTGSGWE